MRQAPLRSPLFAFLCVIRGFFSLYKLKIISQILFLFYIRLLLVKRNFFCPRRGEAPYGQDKRIEIEKSNKPQRTLRNRRGRKGGCFENFAFFAKILASFAVNSSSMRLSRQKLRFF
jgi:hypothetical protein